MMDSQECITKIRWFEGSGIALGQNNARFKIVIIEVELAGHLIHSDHSALALVGLVDFLLDLIEIIQQTFDRI